MNVTLFSRSSEHTDVRKKNKYFPPFVKILMKVLILGSELLLDRKCLKYLVNDSDLLFMVC